MIDCICEYGKNIPEEQKNCPYCGTDLTPLHNLKALPLFYYEKGSQLANQNQWNLAIENLKIAIALDPHLVSAYLILGNIYIKNGRCDSAIVEYQNGLRIGPTHKELKEAKAKAEKELSNLYLKEGVQLAQEKQWGIAIEKLNRAISIDPCLMEAYLVLGEIHLFNNRHDLAIAEYEKVLNIEPINEKLKNARAKAEKTLSKLYLKEGFELAQEKQWEIAIEKLNRAISVDPCLMEAYLVLGEIYLFNNRHDLAIAEYEKGLNIEPRNEKLKKAKVKAQNKGIKDDIQSKKPTDKSLGRKK